MLNFIIDDDNLRSKGFDKVWINNKNMIVTFVDDTSHVLSKYKHDDLKGTLKNLRKELVNVDIDEQSIQRLEIFLSEKLIEKLKEIEVQNDNSTGSADTQRIREELVDYRKSVGQISMEEWQAGVAQRYQHLRNIVESNLSSLWPGLEFVLAVKSILNIKGCTLPFAGILLGPPSCLKTVILELFRNWMHTYYTDNFSARSFVSHSTAVSKEQLEQIDMLPRIKDKLFLTPELAPTFATKDEDLIQVLGIMTRILDGHGYESDSGAHGHRGYKGRMMFAWVGAAVEIPRKVHKHLSTLGPKLYFFRLSKSTGKSEDDYYRELGDDFEVKIREISGALVEYLKYFEICPYAGTENELPKISWDTTKDEEPSIRHIIKLGRLLAHLRGVVPTWETYGTQGSDYSYSIATIEEAGRAITQLRNLAKGHALSKGRNHITSDDIPLVIKVALSTASIERATIFDILIANNGALTTSKITISLNITAHTAHRTMAELKALGLVDIFSLTDRPNSEKKIKLKDDFSWFLSEEFQSLRESFDFEEGQQKQHEPKQQEETETELEEKDTISSQKNANLTVVKKAQDVTGAGEKLEEKSPPTSTNLAFHDDQQLEEHEEKIPLNTDNNSNADLNTGLEPNKLEIKFTPHYDAKEPVFRAIIGEISYDDGLVEYNKLQERLVATGQFFVGEAVLMIEHMERTGRIEKTEYYNIYRIKDSALPTRKGVATIYHVPRYNKKY